MQCKAVRMFDSPICDAAKGHCLMKKQLCADKVKCWPRCLFPTLHWVVPLDRLAEALAQCWREQPLRAQTSNAFAETL